MNLRQQIPKAISSVMLACLTSQLLAQSNDNVTLKAGVTSFGGDEGLEYLNLQAETSLAKDFKAQIGAGFSRLSTFNGNGFSIRHGGSDLEFLGTYAPKSMPYEVGVGLGVPNTPERSEGLMTFRGAYRVLDCHANRLSVESFGVATPNPIVILGGSDVYKVGNMSYSAFAGGPISGTNTVSTTTGLRIREVLYSVGADYYLSSKEMSSVRVAITNQLGWTTGLAATPSLGGQPGIEVSLKVKF